MPIFVEEEFDPKLRSDLDIYVKKARAKLYDSIYDVLTEQGQLVPKAIRDQLRPPPEY